MSPAFLANAGLFSKRESHDSWLCIVSDKMVSTCCSLETFLISRTESAACVVFGPFGIGWAFAFAILSPQEMLSMI